MAKSTSQKIKVGILVIVGTVLLISALYFIGKQQHLFSKNMPVYAVFDNVNGLQIGNNVRYSGVNVGTVDAIEMVEGGMINVKFSVEENTAKFIRKDAVASIGSDGLVGSMVINIQPGKDSNAGVIVAGDIIQSVNKVSMDDMLATLSVTNENVALLSADLLKITKEILEGKGTVGTLINDTTMAQDILITVAALRKTSEDASLAISRINNIIAKINYDESTAAVILSDTAAANQVRAVFANLEKSSEEIRKYIAEIKTGKGAINYITQDESLVREIDSTMIYIKQAADKLDQNMDALKKNFLLRGYFKKQEKKAAKEAKEK